MAQEHGTAPKIVYLIGVEATPPRSLTLFSSSSCEKIESQMCAAVQKNITGNLATLLFAPRNFASLLFVFTATRLLGFNNDMTIFGGGWQPQLQNLVLMHFLQNSVLLAKVFQKICLVCSQVCWCNQRTI